MYQIPIEPKTYRSCAITGHRTLPHDFDVESLKQTLQDLIKQGVEVFYNGLAIGFDLLTARLILELKEEYPHVCLHGCIPFYEQEKYFSEADKQLYAKVLSRCDETTVLDERYHKSSYFKRNDFMVERADVLLAYCTETDGGAAYTVRRFEKRKGRENILFVR